VSERPRVTLSVPSTVYYGVGLHSGADAAVCFLPGASGSGLVFRDKKSGQEIPALAANVTDTSRCTRLSTGGREVQTVEHVLAALAGLGVDDAVIEIEGSELPAADGSAALFVSLIRATGLSEQSDCSVQPLILTHPVTLSEGTSTLVALPADSFRAAVVLDYPRHPYLGTIAAIFDTARGDFAAEIAPARTFGFLSEIEALQARGLGLGASRDNAVVLGEDRYETPLRFANELARHKLLDLIGDLALLGRPLLAHVIAVRPSHTLNTRLAQTLAESSR
jgi:UDP-3-O-[3-hydroxymyristoyl] N-acetylglucosamine deacetylase